MTEKFTPITEVLKKETTSNEKPMGKVDWSDVGDDEQGNDIWEDVAPTVTMSIGEIQKEQVDPKDLKQWPQHEGEDKKKEERVSGGGGQVYQPNRGGFNSTSNTGTRRERTPPSNVIPDEPPYNAKVNNLNYKVTEDDLFDFFGELGVKDIRILKDRETKRSRGMAIIEFKERTGLESALKANGTEFQGRNMEVFVFEQRPREERSRFGSGFGGGRGGSGFGGEDRNKNKYNFREPRYDNRDNREQPMSQQQLDNKERRKLNVAKRTLPLEDRHLNPGGDNKEGNVKEEEVKEEEVKTETPPVQVQERKERENPFGNASPVITKYVEKPQPQQTEPIKKIDDKFSKPFPKRTDNGGYERNERNVRNERNDKPPRKNYQNNRQNNQDQDMPQGSTSWSTRGGRKNIPQRGRGSNQGQPNRNTYPLKGKEESPQSGFESKNHYQILFEGGDEEAEPEEQVENTKKD